MATIKPVYPINPTPPSPSEPPITGKEIKNWPQIDVWGLLVMVGEKLIEHDLNEEWLSEAQVTKYCRRYRVHWTKGELTVKTLRYSAMCYFADFGELMSDTVNVKFKTECDEHGHEHAFFRFYRVTPQGICL